MLVFLATTVWFGFVSQLRLMTLLVAPAHSTAFVAAMLVPSVWGLYRLTGVKVKQFKVALLVGLAWVLCAMTIWVSMVISLIGMTKAYSN